MTIRRGPNDTDPTELLDGDTEIDLAPLEFEFETDVRPARRRAGRETQRFQPGAQAAPLGAVRLPTDSDRPMTHPQVGGRYLNYVIRRRLARGSMGLIYEAEHLHLARPVAIKFLHPSLLTDEAAVLRFLGEARAMARIEHPGIPVIHDFGQDSAGNAYLVMERLEGETLGDRLEGGVVGLKLALEIGAQIADALNAAHRVGVIHRDLKPDNIFLVEGDALRVKLVDFGVSRLAAKERAVRTASGCLVGTPAYMAPEQTFSGEITAATDLYALGCLLFELISGRPVFEGSVAELVEAHRHRRPPALDAGLPRALVELIAKLLDKRPGRRPDNGARVARSLRRIADDLGIRWADPLATTDQLEREDVDRAIAEVERARSFATGSKAPRPQSTPLPAPEPFALGFEPETTPPPFEVGPEGTPEPFRSVVTMAPFLALEPEPRLIGRSWFVVVTAFLASLALAGAALWWLAG